MGWLVMGPLEVMAGRFEESGVVSGVVGFAVGMVGSLVWGRGRVLPVSSLLASWVVAEIVGGMLVACSRASFAGVTLGAVCVLLTSWVGRSARISASWTARGGPGTATPGLGWGTLSGRSATVGSAPPAALSGFPALAPSVAGSDARRSFASGVGLGQGPLGVGVGSWPESGGGGGTVCSESRSPT